MSIYISPSHKILRHPEVITRLRRGELVYPVNVELDLSNRCNVHCKHCDFAYYRDSTIMSLELADRVLDELHTCRVKAVTLTGGGEPTTNPDFPEIARRAVALGFSVGLYTNGTNLQFGVLDRLSWVYVSLDAASREDFQELKGINGFDHVLSGIRGLAIRSRVVIGLGFLLGPHNFYKALGMSKLGASLGVSYVQFRPLLGLESYDWVDEALDILRALSKRKPDIYFPARRFLDLKDKPPRGYTVCRGSALVPCIGADGTVWACPNTRGTRPLGNLAEESLAGIWRRRPVQLVEEDCWEMCRNHRLNQTLEYVCSSGPHDDFV